MVVKKMIFQKIGNSNILIIYNLSSLFIKKWKGKEKYNL